ncbi:hypothetical protein [Haloarcula argentinensis]|uniref:hypothetical protein n=1 Tax=Haloarcula argentinensis TaxID=43776 RepID=UPI0016690700|nr:hypothetical protein [Haloarcula argentinensis]
MATYTEAPAGTTAGSQTRPAPTRTGTASDGETLSTERPDPQRAATVADGATTDTLRPRPRRHGDRADTVTVSLDRPRVTRSRDHATSTDRSGVLIPAAFRPVRVSVVDPDGNPLPEVEWVMSAGVFPTAAAIDGSAQGDLPCLATTYSRFMGVARRDGGPNGVRYTWFSPAIDADGNPQQEPIGPLDDSAEIVLDPVEIKGLYAGTGADFGGTLG